MVYYTTQSLIVLPSICLQVQTEAVGCFLKSTGCFEPGEQDGAEHKPDLIPIDPCRRSIVICAAEQKMSSIPSFNYGFIVSTIAFLNERIFCTVQCMLPGGPALPDAC